VGRKIDEPYRMLDWKEYRSTPARRRRAWATSGPRGSFAAQVFSMSRGLFALEDGSLIHFATLVNAWDETVLYAELYAPDGSFIGYGPVRGYPPSKPGAVYYVHVLWYEGEGVFFVTDMQDGYPVVRRATMSIDGYEFTGER
jgi:hypothetical protein